MAYGLLLPNLTYNLFSFALATNQISGSLTFGGDTDFSLFSVFISPGTTNQISGLLSFAGNTDFSLVGSFISPGHLSFNSSSDFSAPLQFLPFTPIIGTVEFFLTTHSRFEG